MVNGHTRFCFLNIGLTQADAHAMVKETFVDRLVYRFPSAIIVITFIATATFAYLGRDVRFDPSTDDLLQQSHPDVQRYQEFRRIFGNDDLLVIAVYDPDSVFRGTVLEDIDMLTRRLDALPGVEQVLSITNVRIPTPGLFVPQLQQAYTSYPRSEAGLRAFAAEIAILGTGFLVSEDRRMTAIYVYPTLSDNTDAAGNGLVEDVERVIGQQPDRYYLIGNPKIRHGLVTAAVRDTVVSIAATGTVVALVLAALFGSLWTVVLPLLTIGLATVWVGGFLAAAGIPINSWTALIAPLLLVLGIANMVHILSSLQQNCARQRSRQDAVRLALRANLKPCALASVTTALGFLSLTIAEVPVLRDFGFGAAFGVLVAFLLSVLFLPATLMLAPIEGVCRPRAWILASIEGMKNVAVHHPGLVILCFVTIAAPLAYGISRLTIDTDILGVFKPDHELSVANRAVQQHLGGTGPLELVIESGPGAMLSIDMLQRIDRYQHHLEALPEIERTFSVVDLVKVLNMAFARGDPRFHRLPDNPLVLNSLKTFSNSPEQNDELFRMVARDFHAARVMVRLRATGTAAVSRLVREITAAAGGFFPEGVDVHVTGTTALYTEAVNQLVSSQIRSFLTACGTIFISITVAFRSLRFGLFSVVPNLFPIMVVFGWMGLAGISLDLFNAMIASIALGIALDDSIHLLARFQRSLGAGMDVASAVTGSVREVGIPIIATSAIVALGFVGLAASASLDGTARFGYFSAVALVVAFIASVLFLPALVLKFWSLRASAPEDAIVPNR